MPSHSVTDWQSVTDCQSVTGQCQWAREPWESLGSSSEQPRELLTSQKLAQLLRNSRTLGTSMGSHCCATALLRNSRSLLGHSAVAQQQITLAQQQITLAQQCCCATADHSCATVGIRLGFLYTAASPVTGEAALSPTEWGSVSPAQAGKAEG